MLPEIIAVVHEVIDILAGLKAIDATRQAELHAAIEAQPEPEPVPEPVNEQMQEPQPEVPTS